MYKEIFDILNDYAALLSLLLGFIIGLLAIFKLFSELKLRRNLQIQHIELMESDLKFRQQQQETELKRREEYKTWLDEQESKILSVSSQIAEAVSQQLSKNVNWASDALEKANIKPAAQTLFAERWGHFRKEKEFVASNFCPLLIRRLRNLSLEKSHIYLVIDSGTTLFPFFKKIGQETVNCYLNKEEWMNNVTIVTNNLPGVDSIMKYGRIQPNNRYSSLAINCKLLPGAPLPVYSAVTGEDTTETLQNYRNRTENDCFFVGLLTGNWIRVRRSEPPCPVPLARGKGHRGFKQAIIDACDEIYVISPLGKLFVGPGPEELNKILNYDVKSQNPDWQPYKEVTISNEKAKTVSLVTTSREKNRILSPLSERLKERLNFKNEIIEECVIPDLKEDNKNHGHIIWPFDDLPKHKWEEIETEFPHSHTRTKAFMEKFFVQC